MKTGDRNLRVAVLKAIADAINTALDAERTEHLGMLVERYDDEGMKSFDVRLPANGDGERVKVATISLAIPKDSIDVDEADLYAWALDNAGTLLKEELIPAQPEQIIPAQPEQRIRVLDRKRVTEFLKDVKPGPAGSVVHTDTGEIVDGLTHVPGARPKSFSVRFETDGRDELARAWRNGHLEHVLDATPLPALGGEA